MYSATKNNGAKGLLIAVVLALSQTHAPANAQASSRTLKPSSPTNGGPANVIFDSDMWSDIDDALALAMLHALHDRNEINLVGVTISTNDPWCVAYVNLVNKFYGHPQVPVGSGGLDTESLRKNTQRFLPGLPWPVTRYTQRVSERSQKNNTSASRHGAIESREAVLLLREILSRQPDKTVVMIQVGYSTNLARLLESKPDSHSSLNGRELISKKVRLLSVMAGNFREAIPTSAGESQGSPEFNLLADVPSAQTLFARWPTPIVASGSEIGLQMLFPSDSIEHDFAYVENHPIAETYRIFCEELAASQKWSCPHQHATFDLTSVLYAARPDRGYFSLSKPGKITVLTDGRSRFDYAENGRDQYLILNEQQKSRTLEAMVMLTSQPPANSAERARVTHSTQSAEAQ